MKRFNFTKPSTVEEASARLKENKAMLLAGGTDLLGTLKGEILREYPEEVISLKGIPNLSFIREEEEEIVLGSMTTLRELTDSPILKEQLPALVDAAYSVASPNMRNIATLGGNLCQDIRCWYYRYPNSIGEMVDCARKGGDLCYAMMGENHYHSVFGAAKLESTPCKESCPANTDIPGYMEKIRQGDLEGAAKIVMNYNPMTAITSRVCAHFCQEECNRTAYDERVNTGDVERFVGNYILENTDIFMKAPEKELDHHVGIIGTGPGGLSTAYYLRRAGYKVTMYDRMKEAGGCLMYAIPAYRLPKDVVRKFVKALEDMGVEFILNTYVGEDLTLEEIHEKYDSVLLNTGTWKRPLIGISGEELAHFGLDFLVDVNNYINEHPGSDVLVIGGGNVAVDVAVTAKRLGSENVRVICLEQEHEMPAGREEIERLHEEGIELINGWGPAEVLQGDQGVRGIEFKHCPQVFDQFGRFSPVYDEDQRMTIDADVVFMAIGQVAELDFLEGKYQVETERGRIKAMADNATNIPGIFAAGDVTTGPATVVEAVAAGRNTAVSISKYITGEPVEIMAGNQVPEKAPLLTFDVECQKYTEALRPVVQLEKSIYEEPGIELNMEHVLGEAKRCFNCGCLAVNPSDIANLLIAVDGKVVTNQRTLDAEPFFTQKALISDMLQPGEILLEVRIPKVPSASVVHYDKFRLRKSIDFAILALATNYQITDGKVESAKIVLGAVAPIPIRASEAEEYVVGKELTEEVINKTAELALKGALPLPDNNYKIHNAKVLVKRSLERLLPDVSAVS